MGNVFITHIPGKVAPLCLTKLSITSPQKGQKSSSEEIPAKVAADKAYQNAKKNSDKQNARIEHDKALQRVMNDLLSDHTELFKQFCDNPSFRKWLADTIFGATYEGDAA